MNLRPWLQAVRKPTFLQLHWAYFLSTCLATSILFWIFSTVKISYLNSLFMVTAAMTQAGLNTVNMSDLNIFQQCLISVLGMVGNPVVVSIIVIYVRKYAFKKRLKDKRREEDNKRKEEEVKEIRRQIASFLNYQSPSVITDFDENNNDHRARNGFVFGVQNVIGSIIRNYRNRGNLHVDRNSQFHSLSLEERECVRCVEYKAVKFLGYLVIAYYIIWQVYGCLALGAYISLNYANLAFENGVHPWWLGISLAIGAFNNSGVSLLNSSMVPFQDSYYVLISMSILMLAGNTAFPILLRLTLSQILRVIPKNNKYDNWRETIKFILRFPRRVYTNLFPSEQTWCLLALLVFFTMLDWTLFQVLNYRNPAVSAIPTKSLLIDGLFQTISMRSSGFTVVPISSLFIGLQALYVLMMYISAFPITITMRSSNVYEERSLGIYARDPESSNSPKKTDVFPDFPLRQRDRFYFVQEQLRRQLGHDLWFLVIGMLIIISTESANFNRDPQTFAIFNIIFETVSAYGCVGFSVGLPTEDYSFCGAWHSFSRLTLCAIMLRGRHRGLPFDIDKAIQLPGEKMDFAEDQDHQIRSAATIFPYRR